MQSAAALIAQCSGSAAYYSVTQLRQTIQQHSALHGIHAKSSYISLS
jgi:hypothetical protein